MTKIIKTILNDTNEILTVSAYLYGEYGQKDIYIGVPAIVNRSGAREILELELFKEDKEKLNNSCKIIREYMASINEAIK